MLVSQLEKARAHTRERKWLKPQNKTKAKSRTAVLHLHWTTKREEENQQRKTGY